MVQFVCSFFGTNPRALRVRHLLPNQTLAVVHSRQSAAHHPTTIVHCSAVLSKSNWLFSYWFRGLTNSGKFYIFDHFGAFLLTEFLWSIMVKPVLRGLWGINVYWGVLCFAKTRFHWFFPILQQIVTNLAFFLSFWGFFLPEFYFWTFIPMNIMVKTSFERSMGHKSVQGWTYVLQRLVSIDISQFCDK